MFSSNQVLEISGSMSQLQSAIAFAMDYSGNSEWFTRNNDPAKCIYQTTNDGRYCIGWSLHKETPPGGWFDYPFSYDPEIIAKIVRQWIEMSPRSFDENEGHDGASKLGFLLQESSGCHWDERKTIENGNRCIITIRPFWCFYAK